MSSSFMLPSLDCKTREGGGCPVVCGIVGSTTVSACLCLVLQFHHRAGRIWFHFPWHVKHLLSSCTVDGNMTARDVSRQSWWLESPPAPRLLSFGLKHSYQARQILFTLFHDCALLKQLLYLKTAHLSSCDMHVLTAVFTPWHWCNVWDQNIKTSDLSCMLHSCTTRRKIWFSFTLLQQSAEVKTLY